MKTGRKRLRPSATAEAAKLQCNRAGLKFMKYFFFVLNSLIFLNTLFNFFFNFENIVFEKKSKATIAKILVQSLTKFSTAI